MRGIEIDRCATRSEYFALVNGATMVPRWALEHYLASRHQPDRPFPVAGFCPLCDRAVAFAVEFLSPWRAPDGVMIPNWRESMVCPGCRMSARQRIVAQLLRDTCADPIFDRAGIDARSPSIYLMEQRTPLHRWLDEAIGSSGVNIIASEYWDQESPETAAEALRYENAESLTLDDESVDVYVSCDVFEHIDAPHAALRELTRVLKPSGTAILTFPMDPHLTTTVRRALRGDRQVEHILPPVYHRDPRCTAGSLVYYDFGWDILVEMQKAGLQAPTLNVYWSYLCGYLGIQFFFLASKPGDRARPAPRPTVMG